MIINLVIAQLLPEGAQPGVLIDDGKFDACDFRKIFQVFGLYRITVPGMVRPAGVDPGGCRRLEVGKAFPDGAGNRQFG